MIEWSEWLWRDWGYSVCWPCKDEVLQGRKRGYDGRVRTGYTLLCGRLMVNVSRWQTAIPRQKSSMPLPDGFCSPITGIGRECEISRGRRMGVVLQLRATTSPYRYGMRPRVRASIHMRNTPHRQRQLYGRRMEHVSPRQAPIEQCMCGKRCKYEPIRR